MRQSESLPREVPLADPAPNGFGETGDCAHNFTHCRNTIPVGLSTKILPTDMDACLACLETRRSTWREFRCCMCSVSTYDRRERAAPRRNSPAETKDHAPDETPAQRSASWGGPDVLGRFSRAKVLCKYGVLGAIWTRAGLGQDLTYHLHCEPQGRNGVEIPSVPRPSVLTSAHPPALEVATVSPAR